VNGLFDRVLRRFPASTGNGLCFAYGSAVFRQSGNVSKDNVTDFILTVDDPIKWHEENLRLNPGDYSGIMRRIGPKLVADVQDKIGARLIFNTLIPFESGLIKYGVISRNAMLADLYDWESLYAAGRLHKPVKIIGKLTAEEEMYAALRLNLQSALHTSLLLLPETFSEEKLYTTLAGISYTGDFRMVIGEDRNKVSNIVLPNLPWFRQLYSNRVASVSDYVEVFGATGRGAQQGRDSPNS
jgi:translocator assembly and maintenance protein 41